MTYYQFIRAVEGKVKEGVKDNVSVYIHTTVKNNGTKREGLTIEERGINISPTIYLEEYYQQFQQGDSVDAIAGDILKLYSEVRFQRSWEGEFIKDYNKVKGKIIYHLINREANEELLENVPYEDYLDLAIVFYVLLEINTYGMASMMIRNEHLEMWDVTSSEIYHRACQNTWRLLPSELQTMQSVIEHLTGNLDEEVKDFMFVLSNQAHNYGATVILYDNCLQMIGNYLKENYYVLPSSVHEVIIIPESESISQGELSRLVKEINETQVAEDEILSNQAYYFDRKKKKLIL